MKHELNYSFRRIRLDDETELRAICEIDVTIPAKFDPTFIVDEKTVVLRIADLKKRFSDEDFMEMAVDPAGSLLGFHIVKRENDPAGKAFGVIYTLWTAPKARGRGIARRLKQRAEEWARHSSLQYLETWVHAANQNMLALNRKMDFEVTTYRMRKVL